LNLVERRYDLRLEWALRAMVASSSRPKISAGAGLFPLPKWTREVDLETLEGYPISGRLSHCGRVEGTQEKGKGKATSPIVSYR
jgi:hypothetical protein